MMRLPIRKLRLDFQPRENLIDEQITFYVNKFRRREKVNPVLVYYDGEHYYLADGFHRVAAAMSVGRKRIMAEVVPGTLADMEAAWQGYLEAIRESLRRRPGG